MPSKNLLFVSDSKTPPPQERSPGGGLFFEFFHSIFVAHPSNFFWLIFRILGMFSLNDVTIGIHQADLWGLEKKKCLKNCIFWQFFLKIGTWKKILLVGYIKMLKNQKWVSNRFQILLRNVYMVFGVMLMCNINSKKNFFTEKKLFEKVSFRRKNKDCELFAT